VRESMGVPERVAVGEAPPPPPLEADNDGVGVPEGVPEGVGLRDRDDEAEAPPKVLLREGVAVGVAPAEGVAEGVAEKVKILERVAEPEGVPVQVGVGVAVWVFTMQAHKNNRKRRMVIRRIGMEQTYLLEEGVQVVLACLERGIQKYQRP
jgi:hypothetical protein